jgi:hypothetical protein
VRILRSVKQLDTCRKTSHDAYVEELRYVPIATEIGQKQRTFHTTSYASFLAHYKSNSLNIATTVAEKRDSGVYTATFNGFSDN